MTTTNQSPRLRKLARVVRGTATNDGAGVRLTRVIGGQQLPELDPFLLLDQIRSDKGDDYAAGFPNHPHRGFETVTYMIAGRMRHHDNKGNSGLLEAGSVQWMTAGKGLVHSEMPEQENGLLFGFQLWVNLPAKDKMIEPRYQNIHPTEVPEVTIDDTTKVRVVAGRLSAPEAGLSAQHWVEGPIHGIATEPTFFDVQLLEGRSFEHELPAGHNACVFVFEGEVTISGQSVGAAELGVLSEGQSVRIENADTKSRFLLIAGRPLNEPIARYGPFVMNTQQQLREAFDDYNAGRL